MNKRIKQLKSQALKECLDKSDNLVQGETITLREFHDIVDDRFAELLEKEFEAKHFSAGYIEGRSDGIKETARRCARMADCEKNRNPGAFILEQFGIEE
jgi:hypothetical protein